ncbi:MAG: helix-turn-helix domain-containing protein [Clostridia bacterium]|nr:helix-turn-helix domain-containing protein [Deltaproteobacteria bacterium]
MQESRGDTVLDEGGVLITLHDVRLFSCSECGVETPAIPKMEALFREVAHTLASKRDRLMPQEIRFLRKHLGLSGRDFAKKMGVDHTTVSKWQSTKSPQDMGVVAERLLRMFVLTEKPIETYPLEQMATGVFAPTHLALQHNAKGWHSGATVG